MEREPGVLGAGDLATGVRICVLTSSDAEISADLLAEDGRTASVHWETRDVWRHARLLSILTTWYEAQEALTYLCGVRGDVQLGPEEAFLK